VPFVSFGKLVWNQVLAWEHFNLGLIQHVEESSTISLCWEAAAQMVRKEQQRQFNGLAIYVMWNLCKERNRIIFENRFQTAQQVALRVKEDIDQWKRAFDLL
jgi:hypothetical protein